MRIATLLVCVLSIGWLASCSDSNTNAPAPADYYKGFDKLGNYWVYQRNEIDTNGNVVSSTSITDSSWVAGIELYQGRSASKFITMSDSAGKITYDTTYIARSGDSIFTYIGLPSIPILDTAAPTSQWVLLGSVSATTEWTIVPTITRMDTIPIEALNVNAEINASFGITGSRKADTTIKCANGQSYSTKAYSLNINMGGSVRLLFFIPIQAPISKTGGNPQSYFADGIGLVAQYQPPMHFKVGDGSILSRKQPGEIKTLLRYRIQ